MSTPSLRILILCNGDGTRWNNYLGVPKQLAPLNSIDATLIERTIRMCHTLGIDKEHIYVITEDDRLKQLQTQHFTPAAGKWITETLLETQKLWSEHTIILLGDVFYSTRSLKQILSLNRQFAIYGRKKRSRYTYTRWGEIFALRFSLSMQSFVLKHLNKSIADARSGGRGKLWEFYRSTAGIPLDQHCFAGNYFVEINDWTDDFDCPNEYQQHKPICERMEQIGWLPKQSHQIKVRLTQRSIRRKNRRIKQQQLNSPPALTR